MRRYSREQGFSLLEMTIAMGLMLVVTASIFALVNPGQGNFVAEPEVADLQQRTRVATDTLMKDLVMAGAGSYSGQNPMALSFFFAPVMPYRQGRIGDDPPGTFRDDTITLRTSLLFTPVVSVFNYTTPQVFWLNITSESAQAWASYLNKTISARIPAAQFNVTYVAASNLVAVRFGQVSQIQVSYQVFNSELDLS